MKTGGRPLTVEEMDLINKSVGMDTLPRSMVVFISAVGSSAAECAVRLGLSPEEGIEGLKKVYELWQATDIRTKQISNFGGPC